jgi:hypothetical protein
MSTPTLKSRNAKWLWAFAGLYLVALLAALGVDPSVADSFISPWRALSPAAGILATAVPLGAMVLTGLVPAQAKAVLVFWRWPHPLPGSRVFSKLLRSDERIDPQKLREQIGIKSFPRAPGEQNRLWYRIYKQHENAPAVTDAHRMFLLHRDLATLALLFCLASLAIGILVSGQSLDWLAAGCGMAFFFAAISARNAGNRFALSVLAEATAGAVPTTA